MKIRIKKLNKIQGRAFKSNNGTSQPKRKSCKKHVLTKKRESKKAFRQFKKRKKSSRLQSSVKTQRCRKAQKRQGQFEITEKEEDLVRLVKWGIQNGKLREAE